MVLGIIVTRANFFMFSVFTYFVCNCSEQRSSLAQLWAREEAAQEHK